jgi:hypothetical protein
MSTLPYGHTRSEPALTVAPSMGPTDPGRPIGDSGSARLRAEDALLAENALLRERLIKLGRALTSLAGDLAESRREAAALVRERECGARSADRRENEQ